MNNFETFKNLHNQNSPLLLGNAWDVQSALLLEKSGFKAIGTSSGAVASSLGYEDGEKMPFEELLRIVKNILSKIKIPLTVDIEGGYSRDTSELAKNIIAFHQLGVVGINLEDSVTNAEREILSAENFSKILREVKSHLSKREIHIFVNARTDSYIMGLDNPLDQTIDRINLYEKAGADGIFVPCVVQENEIKKIVESTNLPINVMCIPDLPDFKVLENLGVKRISMGPFLYNNAVAKLESSINSIVDNQSFKSLFA